MYVSIHPSIHPSIDPSIYLSFHTYIHISIQLSNHPYINLSIHQSIPIYPSNHLSIYLSIYLSIHRLTRDLKSLDEEIDPHCLLVYLRELIFREADCYRCLAHRPITYHIYHTHITDRRTVITYEYCHHKKQMNELYDI